MLVVGACLTSKLQKKSFSLIIWWNSFADDKKLRSIVRKINENEGFFFFHILDGK